MSAPSSPAIQARIDEEAMRVAEMFVAARQADVERGARFIRNDGTGALRERVLADCLPGLGDPHMLGRPELIGELRFALAVARQALPHYRDPNRILLLEQALAAERDAAAKDAATARALAEARAA